MKTNTPHVLALGAALLLAPLTSTFAQSTWETVDALTPWRGIAIVADNDGNFISLALDNSTSGTGPVSTAASLSSDGGATWQTNGSIAGYAVHLSAAPDGALFASGNRTATVSGRAVIWQSLDHGTTWTQFDPWAGQTTTFICHDVAAGNSGDIYVCGFGTFTGGSWIVRKGHRTTSGGLTWSTVDSQSSGQPQSVFVRPGAPGQPDDVLVAGGVFTMRRSLDGGATWATLGNYRGTNSPMSAMDAIVGPDSSIYVATHNTKTVGSKRTGYTTVYGWLLSRSTDGGATWTDVDYVANGWPTYASCLTADTLGRVFAVGWISTATSEVWLVRGSADGGATWTPADAFLPVGYTYGQAHSIAEDAFGNVCVVGDVENGTASADLAPIRRLPAP